MPRVERRPGLARAELRTLPAAGSYNCALDYMSLAVAAARIARRAVAVRTSAPTCRAGDQDAAPQAGGRAAVQARCAPSAGTRALAVVQRYGQPTWIRHASPSSLSSTRIRTGSLKRALSPRWDVLARKRRVATTRHVANRPARVSVPDWSAATWTGSGRIRPVSDGAER